MPFWSKKTRYAVVNLLVAADRTAFRALLDVATDAARRIVEADGAFEVASAEVARCARALLDQRAHLTHVAHDGEEFDAEEDADAYGQDCYADLSTRYLAGADGDADGRGARGPGEEAPHEMRLVVMLTVAYAGEKPELEGTIASLPELEAALRAIVELHHQDVLLLAQVHTAPAHPDDRLTDEQLLATFPELISL